MIEVEYLSIAEFALHAGVSKQAVYKQVSNANSQIAPYLLRDGRKTLIKASALTDLYGVDSAEVNLSAQNQPKNSTNSTTDDGAKVDFSTTVESQINSSEQPLQPLPTQQNQPLSTDYIEFLKAQINELKTEKIEIEKRMSAAIEEKDKIIQNQSVQLAELAQQVAQIADKALIATSQQQYLTALDKAGDKEEAAIESQYSAAAPQKKGFFKRLFGN